MIAIPTEVAIVRSTSHRSRQKLETMLGFYPAQFFSFYREGSWHAIPAGQLTAALEIKGIRRGKWADDLRKCWNS